MATDILADVAHEHFSDHLVGLHKKKLGTPASFEGCRDSSKISKR